MVVRPLQQQGRYSIRTKTRWGAMHRLYEIGEGLPRRIKQVADLSLLAGAGQQIEEIDAGTVEAATQELGVVTI